MSDITNHDQLLTMPIYTPPDLEDLTHSLAYEWLRYSELAESLPSNGAIDSKSDELASAIQEAIDRWFQTNRTEQGS